MTIDLAEALIHSEISESSRARLVFDVIRVSWEYLSYENSERRSEILAYLVAGVLKAEAVRSGQDPTLKSKDVHLRLVRNEKT